MKPFTLLPLLLLAGPVHGDSAPAPGAADFRQMYVGSYDTDALLNELLIRTALERLLGGKMAHSSVIWMCAAL